jgi:hypothetical protein
MGRDEDPPVVPARKLDLPRDERVFYLRDGSKPRLAMNPSRPPRASFPSPGGAYGHVCSTRMLVARRPSMPGKPRPSGRISTLPSAMALAVIGGPYRTVSHFRLAMSIGGQLGLVVLADNRLLSASSPSSLRAPDSPDCRPPSGREVRAARCRERPTRLPQAGWRARLSQRPRFRAEGGARN